MKKANRSIPISLTTKRQPTRASDKKQVPKRKLPQPVGHIKPAAPPQEDGEHNDSPDKSLVRYINDVMIKKQSGKDVFRDVTTLNLTLTTKDDGKKIRYIENLEGLINLQVLKISHNQISKLERLQHLTRLRELDISCNRIAKIEGLETLIHLQSLNLSHNLIETIPAWLAKKLKALRSFHIAGNLLYSLSDVFRLRPLKDLVHLSLADNQLCDLPHHRLFAVFHLRCLQVLDKQTVTPDERQQADERFEQEEVENLEVQLGEEEKKLRALQEDHSKTMTEQKQSNTLISSLKSRNKDNQQTINELQGELQAKTDLLKRKTAELNRACEKQYRLEQELAFQKIDAKFEPLDFYLEDGDEMDAGTEESPYIGKAGYRRNELARQQFITPKRQTIGESHQQGQDSTDSSMAHLNPDTQKEMQRLLQDRLNDKQRQIAAAQDKLGHLQDQIDHAEKTLNDTHDEMQRLSAETPHRPLSETEKQEMKRELWNRLQAVNDLRQRVAELEAAMGDTLDIIQDRDQEMERLRERQPDRKHPEYAEAATEMANKEQEATDAGDKYRDLQRELEEVVALLADEMDKMNRVKQQMAQEKVELNNDLKDELEDTISGLTDYMQQAQRKAAEQDRKNQTLLKERDQLLRRLRQLEEEQGGRKDGRGLMHDFEDLEEMQRKLGEAEAALKAAAAEKDQLKRSLQAEMEAEQDKENERQRVAGDEASKMNSALQRQKKQAQAEMDALKRRLESQRRQIEALKQSPDQSHDPQENELLASQLQALQDERDSLENELRNQQEQMQDALNATLHPEDVVHRINEMRRHLEDGRGRMRPQDGDDTLGKSLGDVEEMMRRKMKEEEGEKEAARRKQQKAEKEADALRKQVAALKNHLDQALNQLDRQSPESVQQEMRDRRRQLDSEEDERARRRDEEATRQEEDDMMEDMRDEVKRLQEQLRQKPPSYHEQTRGVLHPRQDPHTMAELQQLEAALAQAQRQMRDNDQLAADELTRAEAEMQHLQDELNRQMRQARERERDAERLLEDQRREAERQTLRAVAQAESRAREQAERAGQELARAEADMAGLQKALADREKELQYEIQHGDRASQTLADQRDEIGALYDTMEDQKAEILKLQDALNRLLKSQGVSGTKPPLYDGDINHLLAEIERLNQALQQQKTYMRTSPVVQSSTQPFTDLRPPMTHGDLQAGSRPEAYRYNPSPNQYPSTNAQYPMPSGVQAATPHARFHPPPSTQPIAQQHPTSYPAGVPVDPRLTQHPPAMLEPRNRPDSQPAIPNPQGFGSVLPSASQQAGYPGTTPHGNIRAVPQYSGHNPSAGHPQAFPQPMHFGNTMHAGNAPSLNGQSGPMGNYPTTSTMGQGAGPGFLPGTLGMNGNPQPVSTTMTNPTLTSGVAPPASGQSVMPQIPVQPQMGTAPGGATPGLVLGSTLPTQPTTRNVASGKGDSGPSGNVTAEASTESDTDVSTQRGKKGKTIILPPGGLFCNVPEHHDMEDELLRLKKLLDECRKSKKRKSNTASERVKSTLQDGNKELEALDLAIQKKRGTLRALHKADIDIRRQKDEASEELQELNSNLDRRTRRRDFLEGHRPITPEDEDYEMREGSMHHQDFLEDEITCLEKTLVQRRAELRVADRLLQECQADLKDATDKARSTVEQYDKANLNLKQAEEDALEIEKRSEQAATSLVQAQQHLEEMSRDIEEMEDTRRNHSDKMKAVDEVLTEKDAVFRELEGKIEQATNRLQKLQTDLLLTEEKSIIQQDNAREQDQLISDKTSQLLRLQEQVDEEGQRLSGLDQELGRKQADLHILSSDLESNQKEMVSALQDAESTLTALKQKVKETKASLDNLKHQKRDLQTSIEEQRTALSQTRLSTEQEERTLQETRASIDKGRADLKHTLEMLQLEKTEVEALKLQHESKMADLEKTQLAALQDKSDLESLQVTCQEKRAELDRISKQLTMQRSDKERLVLETTAMEARASSLHKEEEALEERCRHWDGKVAILTKQHLDLIVTLKADQVKMEDLQRDLTSEQDNLDKVNSKRALLTNQLNSYKQQVKETGKELRLVREELQGTEDRKHHIQQELKEYEHQKSEARADLSQLRSSVEKTKQSLALAIDEHRIKQDALHKLRIEVEQRHLEVDDGQRHVDRVQADVEQEENRLSRMIGGLTVEAEHLRSDIAIKNQELEEARLRLHDLHSKSELEHQQQQQNKQTVNDLQTQIAELEDGVKERLEEKTKLAEALNFSHSEINSLRKEKETMEKRLSEMASQLATGKERLHRAKQSFKEKQLEYEQDLQEANLATNEHFTRANRLSFKLNELKEQYLQLKSQSTRELEEERKATADALAKLREMSNKKEEASSVDGMSDLEELDDLQRQKADLTRHLVQLQSNIQQARLDASLIRDGDYLHEMSASEDSLRRQDKERTKMQEEQDRLKLQIRQRVSRQADMLDNVKEKANSTLNSLKRKLDNLEDLVTTNSATTRAISGLNPGMEGDTSLNEHRISFSVSGSDLYPQHDTSVDKTSLDKMSSTHERPVKGILKSRHHEVSQKSVSPPPSRTYSSQRHRRTSPVRTEQKPTDSRLNDFMQSLQRLKEEKLAQLESSTYRNTSTLS
ncbi:uncharacterized protein [Asterias amurensis]|uniref:uncharacterized protein isoform X1 n=1 Tax=Asterias amurensis TaxID=7602 RepID=UPI003AB857C2